MRRLYFRTNRDPFVAERQELKLLAIALSDAGMSVKVVEGAARPRLIAGDYRVYMCGSLFEIYQLKFRPVFRNSRQATINFIQLPTTESPPFFELK